MKEEHQSVPSLQDLISKIGMLKIGLANIGPVQVDSLYCGGQDSDSSTRRSSSRVMTPSTPQFPRRHCSRLSVLWCKSDLSTPPGLQIVCLLETAQTLCQANLHERSRQALREATAPVSGPMRKCLYEPTTSGIVLGKGQDHTTCSWRFVSRKMTNRDNSTDGPGDLHIVGLCLAFPPNTYSTAHRDFHGP